MIDRKEYQIVLTASEPIRIGADKDPQSGIDNPIALVGKRACVPGPSLKGALRAEIERHLNDRF